MPVADLSAAWERGRQQELFHNGRCDGLNKIGYQKSVFPIQFRRPDGSTDTRIVVNGFIPSYRQLFTRANHL